MNKKGSISVDFMFSFVVSLLLVVYFMMSALTFSLMEVAQYISYASAREYFISHANVRAHESNAGKKYTGLQQKFFPRNGTMENWFTINPHTNGGLFGNPHKREHNYLFQGVSLEFCSTVLFISIPFLGNTDATGQGSCGPRGDGFSADIATHLGREPSQAECTSFMNKRVTKLAKKGYNQFLQQSQQVTPQIGNGC